MKRFGKLLRLPIPDREKVNLELPSFTLDVNQIALKRPSDRGADRVGLGFLEYHYLEEASVELCVTPETRIEIARGPFGRIAYDRIRKTELFKARPASTSLLLDQAEADDLWDDIRAVLCPTISDAAMTIRHRSDVNQVFFHTVCSSAVANSAFITLDQDILRAHGTLRQRYGINVMTPNDAWSYSRREYRLSQPESSAVDRTWREQIDLLELLRNST
jgi:hypothetical protein